MQNYAHIKTSSCQAFKKTLPAAFFCCIFSGKGGIPMSKKPTFKERLPRYYWTIVTVGIMSFMFSQPVSAAAPPAGANTIWTQFSSVMQDIYTQILGISTIIAVTAAAIALIVRMVSRNQRSVDEASSWLKRIVVTWVILNTLGFIIAYIQPWIQGGQWTPP